MFLLPLLSHSARYKDAHYLGVNTGFDLANLISKGWGGGGGDLIRLNQLVATENLNVLQILLTIKTHTLLMVQ